MPTVIVDGYEFPAKYIGKGEYSKVYRVGNRVVYYTRGDCAKEVLAMFQYDRIAHLPEMIRHDNIVKRMQMGGKWGTPYISERIIYVFSSPFYRNVTKKDRSAYELMRDIIEAHTAFRQKIQRHEYITYGLIGMENFVKYLKVYRPDIPKSVVRALQKIVNVASKCDVKDIGFDFHKKNFGVNDYGTLIFRDPFYVYSGA